MLTAKDLALICAQGAYETKAEDIRVLDVRGLSSLTDFCVICTATSVPHLRAVLRDVEQYVHEHSDAKLKYKDANAQSLWGVLDYIDVMMHVMSAETREFYGLEKIWENAPEVSWEPAPVTY